MAKLIVAYGTRPEWIKLLPVVRALRERGHDVTEWCSGQHPDLMGDMGLRSANWTMGPVSGIGRTMRVFEFALQHDGPFDAVVVQGDTGTAFACAQAAFLRQIPVAHVEAGLRTYASEPWPEEAFRRQIAAVARWHFCPDQDAADNVRREQNATSMLVVKRGGEAIQQPIYPGKVIFTSDIGSTWSIPGEDRVFVTGNTAIDALPSAPLRVLVTLHRRENWGLRRTGALAQLNMFAGMHEAFVYVVRHPNWNQDDSASFCDNLLVMDPMPHGQLVESLRTTDVVVTDSGGLQEEAAYFGIPCLVVRTATERTALLNAGAVQLIDPDSPTELYDALARLLARRRCYGDGTAALQIADILTQELSDGT